jgi:hypothetical protein
MFARVRIMKLWNGYNANMEGKLHFKSQPYNLSIQKF